MSDRLSREELAALMEAIRAPDRGGPVPAVLHRILHLPVTLRVELGRQRCTLDEVMALGGGKLLELSQSLDQPLEIRVEGCILGYGRVVVVSGGKFGVEIVTVAPRHAEPLPPPHVRRAPLPATRVVPDQLPEF